MQNGVPVSLLAGQGSGSTFADYDFSGVTHLIVEHIFVEAYYEYDEQGANVNNIFNFSDLETDSQLQEALAQFPQKSWLAMDTVFQPYDRNTGSLVADTANFNTANFLRLFQKQFKVCVSFKVLFFFEAMLFKKWFKFWNVFFRF